jgi:poly(3-hydroxybutyrate) depolymerase
MRNMIGYRAIFRAFSLTIAAAAYPLAYATPALQTLNIDPDQISVSGLSSGGYMAVQMHVAYSGLIMGVGVLAAGPYLCAEGNVLYATTRCLNSGTELLPPASYFRDLTWEEAAAGRIDPIADIAGDRIWIFTGGADEVVLNPVVDRLDEYYKFFTDPTDIVYLRDTIRNAQHAMITEDHGKPCDFKGAFINDCDFDAAGALLRHIYGSLKPPIAVRKENLKAFDQLAYSATSSLGDKGYIYVPTDCENKNTRCKLHVAFHGCEQNKDQIGDEYARYAGYNKWAESNDIVVLYPQTGADAVNQCWDWWGYTDPGLEHNYPTGSGLQMVAVKAMIDQVAGQKRADYCGTDINLAHVAAGRAYTEVFWWFWTAYYASGSNEYLGMSGYSSKTLKETHPGYLTSISSCP